MNNQVALDSDFCNMLAPGCYEEKENAFVKSIFESLKQRPVLHPFVYHEELLTNVTVKKLVNEGFIEVLEYDAFIMNDSFKRQYIDTFADFYFFMNSEPIERTFNAITKHRAKRNMGEIHSLIMAQYLSIPLFMSNDEGAKNLATSRINTQSQVVVVKNVLEVFMDVKIKGAFQIDKKAVRSILDYVKFSSQFRF